MVCFFDLASCVSVYQCLPSTAIVASNFSHSSVQGWCQGFSDRGLIVPTERLICYLQITGTTSIALEIEFWVFLRGRPF